MKFKRCDCRVLGALLVLGALNTAALFAQKINTGLLAAPAQSATQPQDNTQGDQSSPNSPANNSGANNGGNAQGNNGKGRSAWQQQSERIHKLMDDLNMTDDQRQQVRTILKNHRQNIMAVRHDSSLSPEDKKAKLKAIRMDMRKKFQAILTPEQKQKLKEIAVQWKKDHPHQTGENTGSNSGNTNSENSAQPQNVKSGYVPSSSSSAPDDDDPASVLIGDDDDANASK